ncbi:MAG: hypothetical protein GY729_03640 [Desulfobacteraceae bacterium]|nr:hypothetical protein [Desulfobacteraceae bacterium]
MKQAFVLLILMVSMACVSSETTVKKVDQESIRGKFEVGTKEMVYTDEQRQRQIKIAVWYPTMESSKQVKYLAFKGLAKKDAAISKGKFPLLIVSHGTGSHRFAQYYMSEFLAANGFMVVSIEHTHDNAFDDKDSRTAANLWNRPKDVTFVLDTIMEDTKFKNSIDEDKIGMIGHSAGGYTAFVIAGAVPNPGRLADYCSTHPEDDYMCFKFEDEKNSDYLSKDLTTLQDKRVRAVFVMAPALGQAFGKPEMEKVNISVFLVVSGKDEILPEPYNTKQYKKSLPKAPQYHEFPEAGHFVYLPECPMLVKVIAMQACRDVGTPRAQIHPHLKRMSLAFFKANL